MKKSLNFATKEKQAKQMTPEQLRYAIADCRDCVQQGVDPDYYSDELSVYNAEIKRRRVN